jgi:hypothetical protein
MGVAHSSDTAGLAEELVNSMHLDDEDEVRK